MSASLFLLELQVMMALKPRGKRISRRKKNYVDDTHIWMNKKVFLISFSIPLSLSLLVNVACACMSMCLYACFFVYVYACVCLSCSFML